MRTSGIKIDINSSKKLVYDNGEKIEAVIKFAVKQTVAKKESKPAAGISNKSFDRKV